MFRFRREKKRQFGVGLEHLERRELFSVAAVIEPLHADGVDSPAAADGPMPQTMTESIDPAPLDYILQNNHTNLDFLHELVRRSGYEVMCPAEPSIDFGQPELIRTAHQLELPRTASDLVDISDVCQNTILWAERTARCLPIDSRVVVAVNDNGTGAFGWWGHCNGWASAALVEREPLQTIILPAPPRALIDGSDIEFFFGDPGDVPLPIMHQFPPISVGLGIDPPGGSANTDAVMYFFFSVTNFGSNGESVVPIEPVIVQDPPSPDLLEQIFTDGFESGDVVAWGSSSMPDNHETVNGSPRSPDTPDRGQNFQDDLGPIFTDGFESGDVSVWSTSP